MWRRWLVILAIAGAIIALLWWIETMYAPLHGYNENYYSKDAGYEQSPGDDLLRIGGIIFWTIVNAIEAHHDLWLVLGTVALAAFTFTLWRSTDKLWQTSMIHAQHMEDSVTVARNSVEAARAQVDLSKRNAERQLRAYVHVEDISMTYVDAEWSPNITITFKNFGATPALSVSHRCKSTLVFIGRPGGHDREEITRLLDLGPSQEHTTSMVIPINIWNFFKPAIIKRFAKFFVFGEIAYFDIFQNPSTDTPHITRYRMYISPDDQGIHEDGGFVFADEGNEAT